MARSTTATAELSLLSPIFLRALSKNSSEGVLILDKTNTPIYYNHHFLSLWGLAPEDISAKLCDKNLDQLAQKTVDSEVFFKNIQQVLESPEESFEQEVRLKNGSIFKCNANPVLGKKDAIAGKILTFDDITSLKHAEKSAGLLSRHDHVTGLLNRNSIQEAIDSAISDKQDEKSGSLILLDLNRFKNINLRYSHAFGDQILAEIADELYKSLNPNPIARYGEDEFLIFLANATEEDTEVAAEKILDILQNVKTANEVGTDLSACLGVSLHPQHGEDTEELISKAEIAMRHAKKRGAGFISIFDDSIGAEHSNRIKIEAHLPEAIENENFHLVYQPLVSLTDHRLIGTEALIRWNHEELGPVSPTSFLPHAEDSGSILSIGEWVLNTATKTASKWRHRTGVEVPVSVNVSPRQLLSENFIASVEKALENSNLKPCLLEIELTETSFIETLNMAAETIKTIRDMGVKVSIDDFGTGFSSMSYLKHFEVDTLKIDRSFTSGIGNSLIDDALVRTSISLAHSLGLNAIAEGVETTEQLEFLKEENCDSAQGFLFSKPITEEEFEKLLRAV